MSNHKVELDLAREQQVLESGTSAVDFFRKHGRPATEFLWPSSDFRVSNGAAAFLVSQQMEAATELDNLSDVEDVFVWTELKREFADKALLALLNENDEIVSCERPSEHSDANYLLLLYSDPLCAIQFASLQFKYYADFKQDESVSKKELPYIDAQGVIWKDRILFACRLYSLSIAENVLARLLAPSADTSENANLVQSKIAVLHDFLNANHEIFRLPPIELQLLNAMQECAQLCLSGKNKDAFEYIQHLPELEEIIKQYIGVQISNELFAWVHSIHEFSTHLQGYGIPVGQYGVGKAKSLSHLLNEVCLGECVFSIEAGKIVRKVRSANLMVYYKNPSGATYFLKEVKQVFVGGRTRERDLNWSISEKLGVGENPLSGARRALKEELQISSGQNIQPLRVDTVKLESPSYPGIVTDYTSTFFEVFLADDDFTPGGYQEHQEGDKTTFFEWTLLASGTSV